jgi:type I restriction enzyme, S subunit
MTWSTAPLERLVRIVGGGTPSKTRSDLWNGTIPWVSPKDMGNRDLEDAEDHISETAVRESATQVVPAGSVLIVVRSGILVRRFPISVARTPVALNQDLKALLPGGALIPDFLAYALEAKSDHVLRDCVKRGATVHSVDIGKLQKVVLPVPAPSEQRRIVEILDQADELRTRRADADRRGERILPALFIEMFGDPHSNPRCWNTGQLGDVIVDTQYGTSKKASSDGAGVLVLRMNNISASGQVDLSDKKYVDLDERELERLALHPGDILFNRTNSAELVGKTGLWNRCDLPAVPASYLIRCRVDCARVTPAYTWAFMNTAFMKSILAAKARRAIGMANINATELRRLPAFFPPLELQTAFGTRLRQLDQVAERRSRARTSIERLFRLILDRAFAGELTAVWRMTHMNELLREMEHQAETFGAPSRAE